MTLRQMDPYAAQQTDLERPAVSSVPQNRRRISSPAPHNGSDALIAAAKQHAGQRGRSPICLAFPYPLSKEEIACLARTYSADGFVVQHDLDQLDSLRAQLPGVTLGAWSPTGRWILPPGTTYIYFAGPWRAITLAMLRQAVRENVLSLAIRWGGRWTDLPLETIRRLAERRYRMRQALTAALRLRQRQSVALARPVSLTAQSAPTSAQPRPPEAPLSSAAPESPAAKSQRRSSLPSAAEIVAFIDAAAAGPPLNWIPGRVVQVCGSLAPGGAERQAAYTARGLTGRPGIESCEMFCDFLTPGHPSRYDFYLPLLQGAGVPARTIQRRFQTEEAVQALPVIGASIGVLPENLLYDVANLYVEFVRHRPEVVHAWLDWSNTRAGLAAALAGVPRIILSGRNLNPTHFALYQPYMDPVYQALCALPNVQLVNNSHAGAQDYAAWLGLPSESIKVVHNGFDTVAAPPTAHAAAAMRTQLGVSPDQTLIGGVFRFSPEKRPLLWIQTAATVARRCPDACFVLFGAGQMRSQIEHLARKSGIADRLHMPGITHEVLTAMRAMDLFLLTSVGEGLPNVLIESQWVGTPVVATDAGGAAEAVNEGRSGWIVREANAEVLADHVVRVIEDAAWRRQAQDAGPAFVHARFGMERMIRDTLELYIQPRPVMNSAHASA